ncbi:MAG: hypothetical protein Q7S40_12145, partial [Opitutaceae bacterium]|nr:hypothetical protein [Opitutaceae bacterium]
MMNTFTPLHRLLLTSLVIGFAPCANAALEFHVSPGGNDANPGSAARPFGSLERARDAVRELKRSGGFNQPVTVFLRGGIHRISKPVTFGPEDSGTAANAITYAAYPGESP